MIQFGTSERKAQLFWFRSGLQSAEHKSFGSVRDFRAQIIWLSSGLQSAEHKSFGSVRDFRGQIIWFSSGLQSAERESFDSVRDFRAGIIWFSSVLQSTERMCVYVYILYMRYQKGQICLLKRVQIYLDKDIFCQYIFINICLLLFLSKNLQIYLALYVFQSKKIN